LSASADRDAHSEQRQYVKDTNHKQQAYPVAAVRQADAQRRQNQGACRNDSRTS
jgi:hypothetical protein